MSDCSECQAFARTLHRDATDRAIPFQATVELTYRCNFDCVHCYNVKEWVGGELTLEEWEKTFDALAEAGCLLLGITGGEPLVHPRFFEIAEAARARRFALKLLTNASLVTEERADRIAKLEPSQVDVSFYGASRETFATVIRGGNAQRDLMIEGVKRLRARGLRVVAKFPLLRENFAERHEMFALAKELGCLLRANVEVNPKDDGDRSVQAHALTGEQLLTWVRETERERKPIKYEDDARLCSPGSKAVAIGPHGDVYPCMEIKRSMGNLRRNSFREIWEQSPGLAEVRAYRAGDFTTCKSCSAFGPCKPCLGVSMRETGTFTGTNSERCRIETTRALLPILP